MAKLYLQRHTQPNIESNICYGVSDIELHEAFEQTHLPPVLAQTEAICATKIYSSPLRRCRELALRICAQHGYDDLIIDERLMELNFGDWELVSWSEIFERAEGKAWFEDYLNCKTPNGESFAEMVLRAEAFLADLSTSSGNIIVVTHSGFIRAILVAVGRVSLQEAFDIKINYGELIEL